MFICISSVLTRAVVSRLNLQSVQGSGLGGAGRPLATKASWEEGAGMVHRDFVRNKNAILDVWRGKRGKLRRSGWG